MTNHLREAILMSNEGARLLHTGRTVDALRLLRRAVTGAIELAASSQDDTDAFIKAYSTTPFSGRTINLPPQDERLLTSNSLVYMHSRPLMITSPNILSTREDLDSLVHTMGIYTTFNLALGCHQFGIDSGTDAPLKRAVELYHAIARTRTAPTTTNDNTALVRCLALNNLVHLHYEQCDFDGSRYYMQWMYELTRQTTCLDSASDLLADYEVEEIKLNFMFLRPPSAAQAA